jgi:hypothetical protein
MCAAGNGYLEVVKVLVQAGVEKDGQDRVSAV